MPSAGKNNETLTSGASERKYSKEGDAVTLDITTGEITPVKVGTVKITVVDEDENGDEVGKGEATVEVKQKTILASDITITPGDTITKKYNGDTDASENENPEKAWTATVNQDAIVGSDEVTAKITGYAFDNKNHGENKAITVTVELDGTAKGNYELKSTAGAEAADTVDIDVENSGTITPKELRIKITGNVTKEYDGNLTITKDNAPNHNLGIAIEQGCTEGEDSITINEASTAGIEYEYTDKNASADENTPDKVVKVVGDLNDIDGLLEGNDDGNYILPTEVVSDDNVGTITKKPLKAVFKKTGDTPIVSYVSSGEGNMDEITAARSEQYNLLSVELSDSDFVGSEKLKVKSAVYKFEDSTPNPDTDKKITVSASDIEYEDDGTGADPDNYSLADGDIEIEGGEIKGRLIQIGTTPLTITASDITAQYGDEIVLDDLITAEKISISGSGDTPADYTGGKSLEIVSGNDDRKVELIGTDKLKILKASGTVRVKCKATGDSTYNKNSAEFDVTLEPRKLQPKITCSTNPKKGAGAAAGISPKNAEKYGLNTVLNSVKDGETGILPDDAGKVELGTGISYEFADTSIPGRVGIKASNVKLTGEAKDKYALKDVTENAFTEAEIGEVVEAVPLRDISINPGTLTLNIDGTRKLELIKNPADTTDDRDVEWSSDTPGVAAVTVNPTTGEVTVTGVAAGSAKITAAIAKTTAADEAITKTCVVTVVPADVPVTGVTLNKTTLSLKAGETETLVPTIAPADAANKNVTWKSSNTSVAAVDNTGKVTAVAAGTADITVTAANSAIAAVCRVTVVAKTSGSGSGNSGSGSSGSGNSSSGSGNSSSGIGSSGGSSIGSIGGNSSGGSLGTPSAPSAPSSPSTPETPSMPETPETPSVPAETPSAPETPSVPETPAAPAPDNQVVTGAVQQEDGTFADESGRTLTNAIVETADGKKYITDDAGQKITSSVVTSADGTMYCTKEDGTVAQNQTVSVDGRKYFAKEDGAVAVSEFCTTPSGKMVYAKADGTLAANQTVSIDGKKYFAKENATIAKKEFCTTPSGRMVYAKADGSLASNQTVKVDGRKYFAKANGVIATKTFSTTPSGNKVYSKANGEVVTNKVFKVNGRQYFAKKNGEVAVNKWVTSGGKRYYCNASGRITKVKSVKG